MGVSSYMVARNSHTIVCQKVTKLLINNRW